MKKTLALLAFVGSCAAPAYAQQFGTINLEYCNKTEVLSTMLKEKFNQSVQFTGIKSPVHAEQFWFNSDSGTYSFVRTNIERGLSCIISSGRFGELTPKEPTHKPT